jgi:transcriptional regulator with GAF, ATPase, and Fis domain
VEKEHKGLSIRQQCEILSLSRSSLYYERIGLSEEDQRILDEIGDLPLFLQAKLLSVIEEKKIRRLGENKYKKINVRFIFATNRNLWALIDKKKFRKDLYYRIRILPFYIPPLKERTEDIPLLVKSILKRNKSCPWRINREITGEAKLPAGRFGAG